MTSNTSWKDFILSFFNEALTPKLNNPELNNRFYFENKKKEIESYLSTHQLSHNEIRYLKGMICFCDASLSLIKDSNNISDIVSIIKNTRFLLEESNCIFTNPELKQKIEQFTNIINDAIETKIILYSAMKSELDKIQANTIPNKAFCDRIKKEYGINYEEWVNLSDEIKSKLYLHNF